MAIAQKLGYVSVVETLRTVTETTVITETTTITEERYKVQAPETMQETFMSESEDEGGLEQFGFFVSLFFLLIFLFFFILKKIVVSIELINFGTEFLIFYLIFFLCCFFSFDFFLFIVLFG